MGTSAARMLEKRVERSGRRRGGGAGAEVVWAGRLCSAGRVLVIGTEREGGGMYLRSLSFWW